MVQDWDQMAVFIVRTERKPGQRRWVVRWQASRYAKQVHLGSFKTKQLAEDRQAWAEKELAQGRAPDPKRIGVVAEQRLVRDVAREWIDARRVDTRPATHASLEDRLRVVVKHVGHIPVDELNPRDVQKMILALKDHGEANRTIRGRVSILRQLVDHAGVEPNPVDARTIRLPPNTGKKIILPTLEEEALIFERMSAEHAEVIRWIRMTGMRISEVVALTWEDIDYKAESVRVLDSKTTAGERWVRSEPQAPIVLPVRPDGVDQWRRVFGVSSEGAVQQAVNRACKGSSSRPAMRQFGTHTWRHLHASLCLRNGMDVVRVAARLGHADISVTLRTYAHLVPGLH